MSTTVTIDPRFHDAVIFDLDGVVTDTASIHAAAWAALFNDFLQRRKASDDEDHSPFTDDDYRHFVDGKARGDGVTDFLASRGISLPPGSASDSTEDTICGLGARKGLERKNTRIPSIFDAFKFAMVADRETTLGRNKPRISHGCVRFHNRDILELGRLMQVGTPVTIR